jgi:hypothetical protein
LKLESTVRYLGIEVDNALEGGPKRPNGRYYDVVYGISLWNGVHVQDVYFDVTAEVNGRSSGIVAADAVQSTLSGLR